MFSTIDNRNVARDIKRTPESQPLTSIETIAFPAISCGVYGYPIYEAFKKPGSNRDILNF